MFSFGNFLFILHNLDNFEENTYLLTLILSLLFSVFIPLFPSGRPRCLYTIIVGCINHAVYCRVQLVYLLLCGSIIYYLLIIRKCSLLYSYIVSFGVLFLARTLDFFDLVKLYPLTNSTLLLFTLRVVDFAHYASTEIQYQYHEKTKEQSPSRSTVDPFALLWLYITYLTFFPGLWAGPVLPPGHVFAALLRNPLTARNSRTGLSSLSHGFATTAESNLHKESDDTDVFDSCSDRSSGSITPTNDATSITDSSETQLERSNSISRDNEVTCRERILAGPSSGKTPNSNYLKEHFREALDFVFVRLYQSSFHFLSLAILLPYIGHIRAIEGKDAVQLHNIVRLHSYVSFPSSFRYQVPSIKHTLFSPFIRGIQSYTMLTMHHLVFRARFFVAWFLCECATVIAGVKTNANLDLNESIQLLDSTFVIQILEGYNLHNYHHHQCHNHYSRNIPWVLSHVMDQDRYINSIHSSSICRNYCSWSTDLPRSLGEVLKGWNQTVQSWLFRNIYKSPLLQSRSSLQRRIAVVAVSAFWHGLHPGYYLAFLSLPFFQMSQVTFQSSLNLLLPTPYLDSKRHHDRDKCLPSVIDHNAERRYIIIKNFINIITTHMLISFAVTPFVCLTISNSLIALKNLNYYGVYLALLMASTGFIVRVAMGSKRRYRKVSINKTD